MVEGENYGGGLIQMSNLEELRKSFRPRRVTTLFVGESAPQSGKFFYSGNSSLFYAMQRAFGGKETFLEDFKKNGFYLDDLASVPINKLESRERSMLRWKSVTSFADRLKDYKPEAIVIVMRAIKPMVLEAMRKARLSYEPYCTPHPAFGNWTRFHTAMTEIIYTLPEADSKNRKGMAA
jgi:hypothetical protein